MTAPDCPRGATDDWAPIIEESHRLTGFEDPPIGPVPGTDNDWEKTIRIWAYPKRDASPRSVGPAKLSLNLRYGDPLAGRIIAKQKVTTIPIWVYFELGPGADSWSDYDADGVPNWFEFWNANDDYGFEGEDLQYDVSGECPDDYAGCTDWLEPFTSRITRWGIEPVSPYHIFTAGHRGCDAFRIVAFHELKHREMNISLNGVGDVDEDHDGAPDWAEDCGLDGICYRQPHLRDQGEGDGRWTNDPHGGYTGETRIANGVMTYEDPDGHPIDDAEYLCIWKERYARIGLQDQYFPHDQDWAFPGTQTNNPSY